VILLYLELSTILIRMGGELLSATFALICLGSIEISACCRIT
jgi:hypothetical protein